MAGLGGPPVLVPTISTYHAYFSSSETDPFSGEYQAVLEPYLVEPMNAGATQAPASVSQKIYTTRQQEDPIVFLLWHATPGIAEDRDPGRVSLPHSVSHYPSRMGRPASQWDNRTFANRVDVS